MWITLNSARPKRTFTAKHRCIVNDTKIHRRETLTDEQNRNNYWYAKIYKQRSQYVHFGVTLQTRLQLSWHRSVTDQQVHDVTRPSRDIDNRRWLGNGAAGRPVLAVRARLSRRLLLLVHVALERPLWKDTPAGVREPVVDLGDVELSGRDERLLLVVVRVWVLLVLAQPIQHDAHRLVQITEGASFTRLTRRAHVE